MNYNKTIYTRTPSFAVAVAKLKFYEWEKTNFHFFTGPAAVCCGFLFEICPFNNSCFMHHFAPPVQQS